MYSFQLILLSSSPPRTLSFTHIHVLHKLFTLSLYLIKPPQRIFPSPIPLHHTSLHLHKVPCHTSCSHPPILSRHMLFSDISFSLHAFLTDMPIHLHINLHRTFTSASNNTPKNICFDSETNTLQVSSIFNA